GDVVHEHRAFLADLVDVRRFSDHHAAMIDAWLHPTDIVAHDEEDVRLLLLLRGCRHTRHNTNGDERGSAPRGASVRRPSRCICNKDGPPTGRPKSMRN